MGNNKKIGLLTFHTPDNYGAVFQTFALQEYIRTELEQEIEIIDFCTPQHLKAYSIFKKKSNNLVKDVLHRIITATKYLQLKNKKRLFEQFRNDYFKISKIRYNSEGEFLGHTIMYDLYIVGSDQVFNPYNEFYKSYYLAFEKKGKKKIAYAPSFGISDFSDLITEQILPFLNDFDFLSCREQHGAEYLTRILNRKIPVVVDPVFLISKAEWLKIARVPHDRNKFIFVYDLCGGDELISIAKSIAKEKSLKVICATGRILNNYKGIDVRFDIGPAELLGYINNAEYVVTDSFHGTSLSLILQKKVIPYIALPHAASRIISIMELLGISNQIVTQSNLFDKNNIVFNDYQQKMLELVEKSKQYLNACIK